MIFWIISMFFFTYKYVYSKYYMSYFGTMATSGRSTQLQQCLGISGLGLAKAEEKSCLLRNVSSVHLGSSGSL